MDDAAGAGNPLKRARIAVVDPDVIVDLFYQVANASKGPVADFLARDFGEPARYVPRCPPPILVAHLRQYRQKQSRRRKYGIERTGTDRTIPTGVAFLFGTAHTSFR